MLTLTRQAIKDGAERAGVTDYEIRGDYSGRGMLGGTCAGLVVDDAREGYAILAGIVLNIATDDERGFREGRGDVDPADLADVALDALVVNTQADSMGLSTIVYLPMVALDG